MAFDLLETIDVEGKTAAYPVRFRTEITMGFPPLMSKFLGGRRYDSTGAA